MYFGYSKLEIMSSLNYKLFGTQIGLCILIMLLVFSCKSEPDEIIPETCEDLDISEIEFEEGFVDRRLDTNLKMVFPEQKSILFSSKIDGGEEQLIKYHIPTQSELWQAETWYEERAGALVNNHYHDNILFYRNAHLEFAINTQDGSIVFDEERTDCDDSGISGLDYTYYSKREFIDEATQLKSSAIVKGNVLDPAIPEVLVVPPYDAIGSSTSLGRVMSINAFENEQGNVMLAVRFHDNEPFGTPFKNFFSVFNVSQNSWEYIVPLKHHITGGNTIINNDVVFMATQDSVSCIDLNTGIAKWATAGYGILRQLLSLYNNDVIIRTGGNIERRDGDTGQVVWSSNLGDHIQRFIVVNERLFCVGREFTVSDVASGNLLLSYASPYANCDAEYGFGYIQDLHGYFDEETNRYHIFLNIDDHLLFYELEG